MCFLCGHTFSILLVIHVEMELLGLISFKCLLLKVFYPLIYATVMASQRLKQRLQNSFLICFVLCFLASYHLFGPGGFTIYFNLLGFYRHVNN